MQASTKINLIILVKVLKRLRLLCYHLTLIKLITAC